MSLISLDKEPAFCMIFFKIFFLFFYVKRKESLDSILFCDILVSINLEFRNSRNEVGQ